MHAILYTGLSLPRVTFAFLHLQIVSPLPNFAKTQLCFNRDILRYRIRPVLNFPAENESEKGKNKSSLPKTIHIIKKMKTKTVDFETSDHLIWPNCNKNLLIYVWYSLFLLQQNTFHCVIF